MAEPWWRQEQPSGRPTLLATVRHGQTVENALGRWLGLRDSPLTEEGRQQAMVLGTCLPPKGSWAAIYTSPLVVPSTPPGCLPRLHAAAVSQEADAASGARAVRTWQNRRRG